jgi:hypothetical protein
MNMQTIAMRLLLAVAYCSGCLTSTGCSSDNDSDASLTTAGNEVTEREFESLFTGQLYVSADLRLKHPELVELILQSESMDDAERQQWIDELPGMTVEQCERLKAILVNERDQLKAIDAKYAEAVGEIEDLPPGTSLHIPKRTKEMYPALVELILGSESMTDSERQYWLNVLPSITEEQRAQLQLILRNEKEKLEAIEANHS